MFSTMKLIKGIGPSAHDSGLFESGLYSYFDHIRSTEFWTSIICLTVLKFEACLCTWLTSSILYLVLSSFHHCSLKRTLYIFFLV